MNPETFDVFTFVNEGLPAWRAELRCRPVDFEVDCPATIGTLRADRAWVTCILGELISNCRKFISTGTVRLEVGRQGSSDGTNAVVTFRVIDTGPGIPAEWLDRIFEPFEIGKYYADRTGLGLNVVRHLCRQMGGTVGVISQVGKGSTFTVALPAHGVCQG